MSRAPSSAPRRSRGRRLRQLALGAIVVGSVLSMSLANGPSASASSGRPPVLDHDAPDPDLVRDGSDFYLYTTNHAHGTVPVWRSSSLEGWTFAGDAFPRLGSWASMGWTWAPSVARIKHPYGHHWVLFYTARHQASNRQCIGRAVAQSPTGPFVDHWDAPLICQTDRGGSIDASYFRDPVTGQEWLHWKSDDNALRRQTHLWAQELNDNGLGLVGTPRIVLSHDRSWETPLIEQPEMIHVAGRYWLFYAANWWDSPHYGTGFASCAGPAGPCAKVTNHGPWHASNPFAAGPGAASFQADAQGRLWMTYHGWPGPVGYPHGKRAAYVSRVTFDHTGPHLHDDVPAWMANSPLPFHDVPPGSTHDPSVRWLAASGVTTGCGVDRYCQLDTVTRAQMASFLWRLNGSPRPSGTNTFTDVASGDPHRDGISWLAERGITLGVTPDRFHPGTSVTREQMAAFLWRMNGSPDAAPHTFGDASENPALGWMAEHGVTTGCTPTRYCGSDRVTRAQMATFLWRHQGSPRV